MRITLRQGLALGAIALGTISATSSAQAALQMLTIISIDMPVLSLRTPATVYPPCRLWTSPPAASTLTLLA